MKKNTPIEDMKFPALTYPSDIPVDFPLGDIPDGMIIHRGIFSPDFKEYYYTLSDIKFNQFDIYITRLEEGNWTTPEKAAFNSSFSDHGMIFSPEGGTIYFSSTRPTKKEGVADVYNR